MKYLLIGLLCAPIAASGHDFWINNGDYKSLPGAATGSAGVHCCGPQDCASILRTDVQTRPDGYHLPTGEVVPYNQAQPSEDNSYWVCRQGITGLIRCFFSPTDGV